MRACVCTVVRACVCACVCVCVKISEIHVCVCVCLCMKIGEIPNASDVAVMWSKGSNCGNVRFMLFVDILSPYG